MSSHEVVVVACLPESIAPPGGLDIAPVKGFLGKLQEALAKLTYDILPETLTGS